MLLSGARTHARTHDAQTKADENAAKLAQVLRRERAGQGNIADAQAEVEELKGELGHMREAFGRYGTVHTDQYGRFVSPSALQSSLQTFNGLELFYVHTTYICIYIYVRGRCFKLIVVAGI